MGVYLSSPVTEKDSIDEQCERFTYGASSMQGWRITQEDAHNCIPVFDAKSQTSFFAVYDGHGGSEVAKYCERHFPDFVKNLIDTKEGTTTDLTQLTKNAFLAFDATLTKDAVIKELKELAGKDDDMEDEEDVDPVGRSETDMLKEEADMPLEQLLSKYQSGDSDETEIREGTFQSPALKAKGASTSSTGTSSQFAENSGPSSSSVSNSSSSTSPLCTQDNCSSSPVPNGVEDENNSNTNQSENADTVKINCDGKGGHASNNNNIKKAANFSPSYNLVDSGPDNVSSQSKKNKLGVSNESSESSSTSGNSAGVSSSSSSSHSTQAGGSASGTSSDGEPSGSGTRVSKAKAAVGMAVMDGAMDSSDDDDEEDEDAWEDMSEEEEEDDEEEEEEDHDEDVPMMDMTNEEPGSDSGCTACVVLMQGKKLIVANAGDSRCVLARAGKAVELSFDHKPEDDVERERIEKAGGKVTADGRVNGGLNLSRAIGDHVYKRNKDLPAEEQMITSLPDIETAELCDEDQFVVIACDGIWNYLSSQEVVDYILEKLNNPEKKQKPSIICEELFDHCLAPNTFGDGTGCDNMTCIVIVLDTFSPTKARNPGSETAQTKTTTDANAERGAEGSFEQQPPQNEKEDDGSGALKRCADNVEVSEAKRVKIGEEVA